MQTTPVEHWTTRIFAQETRRRMESAAKRGYTVMSITLGEEAPIVVYGIFRKNQMLARCATLDDAAEVADALAQYRQIH